MSTSDASTRQAPAAFRQLNSRASRVMSPHKNVQHGHLHGRTLPRYCQLVNRLRVHKGTDCTHSALRVLGDDRRISTSLAVICLISGQCRQLRGAPRLHRRPRSGSESAVRGSSSRESTPRPHNCREERYNRAGTDKVCLDDPPLTRGGPSRHQDFETDRASSGSRSDATCPTTTIDT